MIETERLLSEHRVWLEEYFHVGIENIERHVMESLRRHFNHQFQRWFEILVEDPALRVKVDENFTAQITREGFDQDYLQDYLQLSGGERTSIAMAYRLALNIIVQQVSAGGSSNLSSILWNFFAEKSNQTVNNGILNAIKKMTQDNKASGIILEQYQNLSVTFAGRNIMRKSRKALSLNWIVKRVELRVLFQLVDLSHPLSRA